MVILCLRHIIHESGHALMVILCNGQVTEFHLDFLGGSYIRYSGEGFTSENLILIFYGSIILETIVFVPLCIIAYKFKFKILAWGFFFVLFCELIYFLQWDNIRSDIGKVMVVLEKYNYENLIPIHQSILRGLFIIANMIAWGYPIVMYHLYSKNKNKGKKNQTISRIQYYGRITLEKNIKI